MQVARDAVEAHGGIGFTWECDVQIWFKRALFDRASSAARRSPASRGRAERVVSLGPPFARTRVIAKARMP